MNNAKMWLVVKPTVGIPLFLTGVAVGSFAVHVAVLSNTTWVADFLAGRDLGSAPAATAMNEDGALPEVASYTMPESGAQQVLVVMPDGSTAKAVLQSPVTLAAMKGEAPLVVDQ